jgi:ADP-glucose pyrophosphorylase
VPRTLPGARPTLTAEDGVVSSDPLTPGARVRESVLYPGSVIEPGARVERSVVLPGARVSACAELRDTIVLPGEQLTRPRSGLADLA